MPAGEVPPTVVIYKILLIVMAQRFRTATKRLVDAFLHKQQARIQSMKNQVKNTQKAIKAEKARQKIKAGQHALANIN